MVTPSSARVKGGAGTPRPIRSGRPGVHLAPTVGPSRARRSRSITRSCLDAGSTIRGSAMVPALRILNALLPCLYGGLAAAYALLLLRDGERLRRGAPRVLAVTVALHFAFLLGSGLLLDRHPMANKFELFTFVALALAASYLWVERRRGNPYTGAFPLALCAGLQACASLGWNPAATELPERLRDPLFGWHTGAAAVALAAFSLGAVYGVVFLGMYRLLKENRVGPLALRLPSLDSLAAMSLHAGEAGFAALTLAVVLGAAWLRRTPEISATDPKVLATLAAWAVYGLALAGRHLGRWGGIRLVSLGLAGYATLLASLLTVGRLFPSFHRFGG
jgi:ABC-type uncharacterized transport system permease subunit